MAVPVEIQSVVRTEGRFYYVEPFEIPGIAAADALDANDQMGLPFSVPVPVAGTIVAALYHDLDDEGISKRLYLFRGDPSGGVAASDAAFSLADATNTLCLGVLNFTVFHDAVNNQVAAASELPFAYWAPAGKLWFALQTLGADNIAAGSMPRLSLTIERASAE